MTNAAVTDSRPSGAPGRSSAPVPLEFCELDPLALLPRLGLSAEQHCLLHGCRRGTTHQTVQPVVVGLMRGQLPLVHCAATALGADAVLGREVLGEEPVLDGLATEGGQAAGAAMAVANRSCTKDFQSNAGPKGLALRLPGRAALLDSLSLERASAHLRDDCVESRLLAARLECRVTGEAVSLLEQPARNIMMVRPTDLKQFLLHEDRWVRDFVAAYFSDSWSRDEDLMRLVLKACEAYGDDENSYVLARAWHFTLASDSLLGVLERLRKTKNHKIVFHLNNIVSRAPVQLLFSHETDILDTPNVTQETVERLDRRRSLAGEPGEQLWQELRGFSDRSREKKYVGEIDHAYAHDLVEALGAHDVPDSGTVCKLLSSQEVEGEWLENFLVELAGARMIREAIPILVDKLRIDADYFLECTVRALSRIGDPEAVGLVRQAFPDESWVFRLCATGLLGDIKAPESEEAVLALLDTEKDTSIRTDLCFALCKLFSERGVAAVQREIESGYDRASVCLEEELLVVADVVGLSLPEGARWRVEREETRRAQEQRRAELDRMGEQHYALKERGADRSESREVSAGWGPSEQLQSIRQTREKVGRNDPCPCGSGMKYKKCCGKPKSRPRDERSAGTAAGQSEAGSGVYQLRITLLGVEPSVWRRILVPGNMMLEELHYMIQDVMGWTHSHLHQFEVFGVDYSDPQFELENVVDESAAYLHRMRLHEGAKFLYRYDFGDNWEHEVAVEKIDTADQALLHPVCQHGARACPPEDCGGAWGYEELLKALRDPEHPDHEEMLEWVGGSFDAEAFDLQAVNQKLWRLS